jgi:hypothetical protein
MPAWTLVLLFYASCYCWGDKYVPPHPASFQWDEISQTVFFFFNLGYSGTVIFPSSASNVVWDAKCMPLHLGIGWDGVSLNFCWIWLWITVLTISISASQIGRITNMSHQHPSKDVNLLLYNFPSGSQDSGGVWLQATIFYKPNLLGQCMTLSCKPSWKVNWIHLKVMIKLLF